METSPLPTKRRRGQSARYRLCLALAVDLLVAVVLSLRDDNFLWNLACFWLPQLGTLGILTTLKVKPAALVGTVYALTLHLALYGALVFTLQVTNSTVWAWYFFSLPGSVIGATIAFTITARKRPGSRKIVYFTGLGTFIGALLAQVLASLLVLIDISPSRSNDRNRQPARTRSAGRDEIRRFELMDIAIADHNHMRGRAAGPTVVEPAGSSLLRIDFLVGGPGAASEQHIEIAVRTQPAPV